MKLTLRILLLVCVVAAGGCSDQERKLPDSVYTPQSNFLLSLHTSGGTFASGFYFMIDTNREFIVLSFNSFEENSSVSSGKTSIAEFTTLLDNLRISGLLNLSQEPIRAPADSLIYKVDLLNGDRRRNLWFLPKDSRFKALIESVRSIKEKGLELEEDEALQAIRKVSYLGPIGAWSWVGWVLKCRHSPKASSLLLSNSNRLSSYYATARRAPSCIT